MLNCKEDQRRELPHGDSIAKKATHKSPSELPVQVKPRTECTARSRTAGFVLQENCCFQFSNEFQTADGNEATET